LYAAVMFPIASSQYDTIPAYHLKVKFTGLTQNSQVDPGVLLKIPIKALELSQILGQPCEF
jgi:hypothetical protein